MKKPTTENQPWATLTHLGGSRDHGAYLLGEPDGEKIKRRKVSPCAFAAIDGLAFNRVIAVVEREGKNDVFLDGKLYRRFGQLPEAVAAFHTLAACYHQEAARNWAAYEADGEDGVDGEDTAVGEGGEVKA